MLNKTKAAMPGRQWYTSKRIENDISIVIDQVNACNFAHISFNYGKSPGVTAAMPRFLSEGVRHWRSAQSPNFSGDLQSAENSADTWLAEKPADLLLDNNIPTEEISSLEQNQQVIYFPCAKNTHRQSETTAITMSMMIILRIGAYPFGSSLACFRWRRLISPLAAVTRKPAVLSPSCFKSSISSITSCGIRTVVICDLAFFAPVAITETPCVRCISVYAKKMIKKDLRCISLWANFKSVGDIHLSSAKPAGATNTGGPLTKPLIGVTVMADMQSTQTHPKFTWRFLALSASTRNVIHITAATEREARDQSPVGCVMVFAGRLPVQGVSHA